MARRELLTLRSVLTDILSYNRQIAAERLDLACPHCGSPLSIGELAEDRRVAVPAEGPRLQR